jgi:DeoR family suf operon transcriptional repressor
LPLIFGIIPSESREDSIVKSITSNGKHSTRDIILQTLKVSNRAKVEDLADAANVSPVTVRHHLNALQADNLIEVSSVRRKVGRPYYVYSLSEKGHELFPRKYIRLTNRLLDEMKASLSDELIGDLFNGIVENIVEQHRSKFEDLDFEERLAYLVDLLAEEGFMAKWERANGKYKITEFSCPYYSVVDHHSELCALDKELIVNVMQTPIEQHSCMVNGDTCCEFTFSTSGIDA